MELFTVCGLTFTYPEQARAALSGVDLSVHAGEFLVLCGPSGCGKSTLLRHFKTVLEPHGEKSGQIFFQGRPLAQVSQAEQSRKIGFVSQSPENQLVTDKVWHELAFGLESLGCDTQTVRRRVAETACFFGIQSWFYQDVARLSGGQKQLLNLAAVMVMQPEVLVLDEPTSQLDPIAAADFLAALGRINRELGTTVLLTEHRLEETFALADRVAVMDRGKLLCTGTAAEVGQWMRERDHALFPALPTTMRVWRGVRTDAPCPVTVGEGRRWLSEFAATHPLKAVPKKSTVPPPGEVVIDARELWFRYERELPDVVRGLSLQVCRGELFALLGGNGAGKSTLLKLLCGLRKPYRGTLQVTGSTAMLPQNPQTLFVRKTVREDLFDLLRDRSLPAEEQRRRVARVVRLCRLEPFLERHPYDLSGGEQQRAALAKVLLLEPDILLLDEPTKGMDGEFRQMFAQILQSLRRAGMTVVMVSHDVEFCAECASRCALVFDGGIAAQGEPISFFSGNSFYTTAANRMARELLPGAITAGDIIAACGGQLPETEELPESQPVPLSEVEPEDTQRKKLSPGRRAAALVSGACALGVMVRAVGMTDLNALVDASGLTVLAREQLKLYGLLILALTVLAVAVARRTERPGALCPPPEMRRRLPKRTAVAVLCILLLIPVTLLVGIRCFGGRKYYFISLLVLLEAMLPFFLIFEGRKPRTRELVILAVLCALNVAGRAAFFMLPEFKPVVAGTILAGVALGGETGFLVGAVTMLLSNVLFSQGPWTPWQMFAMGMVGFLAGVLRRNLRRGKLSLCAFGAFCSVVIYGGIMNFQSALLWAEELNWNILLTYYVTGVPVDLIRAAATWFFLWFAAEPLLEKLDRVKVKYGLTT